MGSGGQGFTRNNPLDPRAQARRRWVRAPPAQYISYEITTQWLASLSLTLALLELSGVGLVWLVFYPPAVYRRWINRAVIHHARAA